MSQSCCRDCKGKIREHIASLLPFRILEAALGKQLRISGVAMAAGISRNFNVYTIEELQSFAPALVGAPVYIEHVAVDSAAGKVTKCTYDPTSRCLLYEAEIYDPVIADKIRNGLIQHVSVGADYDALDVVDAKIPHGLSKPELSLVAVPGIPETNIQVLERLKENLTHQDRAKVKLKVKEALGEAEVFCVFCSNSADYFVSICQPCMDKFSVSGANLVGVEKLDEKTIENISERVTAKIGEKISFEVEKLNFADGKLDLEKLKINPDPEQIIAELDDVRGIGVWTAELTMLRGMQKLDAFPADDFGIKHVISRYYYGGNPIKTLEAREIAKAWGRWRHSRLLPYHRRN